MVALALLLQFVVLGQAEAPMPWLTLTASGEVTISEVICGGTTEPVYQFRTNLGDVSFSPCTEARRIASVRSQNTHERIALVDKRAFIVEYYVSNQEFGSVPLTSPPGQIHYAAEITIYEVVDGKKMKVAGPFPGQWTRQGCFEDDPVYIVRSWLKGQQRPPGS